MLSSQGRLLAFYREAVLHVFILGNNTLSVLPNSIKFWPNTPSILTLHTYVKKKTFFVLLRPRHPQYSLNHAVYLLDSSWLAPGILIYLSPGHRAPFKNFLNKHPCGDYWRLNSAAIPNRYPGPHIQDCTQIFYEEKIFTTLDLDRAYHQILC